MTGLNSFLPSLPPQEVPEAAQPETAQPEAVSGLPSMPVDTVFTPTESMLKIKARLFSRFEPSINATAPADLSKAAIIRLTECTAISEWSKKPGFMEWLVNPNLYEEKLAHLEYLAFAALDDILRNQDAKAATAKMQAIRMTMELTGRIKGNQGKDLPNASKDDKREEAVKKMSDEDLAKIINVTKLSNNK